MKMKTVAVYGVSQISTAAVGEHQDYLSFHALDIDRLQPVTSRAGATRPAMVTTHHAPVYHYRRPDGGDLHLAISPELRDILEDALTAPYRRREREAVEEMLAHRRRATEEHARACDAEMAAARLRETFVRPMTGGIFSRIWHAIRIRGAAQREG